MTKYDNIPGFPGYYISKRGGLWSNRKNGQWKKLKPHLNKMWNKYQVSISCITPILRERRIPRTRDTKFKIKK